MRRGWFVAGLLGSTALMGGVALADSTCPSGQFLRAFAYPSSDSCAAPSTALGLSVQLSTQPGFSGSRATTTGTIAANSPTLTLGAAILANGQGVWLNHAGASFTLGTPASCTVTPEGTPGLVTYIYQIAAYDPGGGVSAYVQCSTTTGNATLSQTNYNKVTVSSLAGAAGFGLWGAAGSTGFLAQMSQLSVNDMGGGAVNPPVFLPSVAPLSSLPDALVTSVINGGGTTKVTLAANASNAVSSALIEHDDTAAAQAAVYLAESLNLGLGINASFNTSSPLRACSGASCSATMNIVGTNPFESIIFKLLPNFNIIYDNALVPGSWRNFGGNVAAATGASASSYDTGGALVFVNDGNHVSDRFENLNGLFLYDTLDAGIGSHIRGIIAAVSRYGLNFPNGIGDSSLSDLFLNPVNATGESSEGIHGVGFITGIRLYDFKCLSGPPQYDKCIHLTLTGTDGGIYIGGSWSIEGFLDRGIYLDHTNSAILGSINIVGAGDFLGLSPSLSATGIETHSDGTQWVQDFTVGRGIDFANLTNSIKVGGAAGVNISGTQHLDDTNGVIIDSHSTNCIVKDNNYTGVTTPLTDGSNCVKLTLSNALGSDTALNNVSNYFLGPSISVAGPALGTVVTWDVKASLTVQDTAGGANIICGISDGSSFYDTAAASTAAANAYQSISLTATVSTAASTIGAYCRDISSTSGKIIHNVSGLGFDSSITATRVDN